MQTVEFKKMVYQLTSKIPRGRITTYGAIARALGKPKASRAVGKILNMNPTPVKVPCHRVVYSDGRIGGYGGAGGIKGKVKLLTAEGVHVEGSLIGDFERLVFDDWETLPG